MNPTKLKPYVKAYELRQMDMNYTAWLQGLYTHQALMSALSGLSGKKGKPYLKEPIPFTTKEVEEAERKKQDRMKRQFETFVQGLEKCQTTQSKQLS